MGKPKESIDIISYLVIWDDKIGPKLIDSYPKNPSSDIIQISENIFQSYQTIFGNASDVTYDRTNLVLPLKSHKKIAKCLLDSIPNPKMRGGKQPFINVILLPLSFPEKEAVRLNEIQEKILDEYIKTQRATLIKYFSDISAKIEDIGSILIKDANQIFKDKNYKDAINSFKSAIDILTLINKTNKISDAVSMLNKARNKYSEQLLEQSNSSISKKEFDIAEKELLEALKHSEDSNNKSLLKKIRKSISTNYEFWAISVESVGDKVFDTKDYKSANTLYEQALGLSRKAGRSKMIKRLQKKLSKAPNF